MFNFLSPQSGYKHQGQILFLRQYDALSLLKNIVYWHDKIIFINWMQSGTVLHLALLKKLSNHYPNGELSHRFKQFKVSSTAKCSPRTPPNYHHFSIQKYEHYQPREAFKSTIKPRKKRLQKKLNKPALCNEVNQSVTGWSTENQYQVNYTDKLKRDKYDFFPKLIDSKRDNTLPLREKEVSSQILQPKNNYNFIVQDVKTENIIQFKKKQKKRTSSNKSTLIFQQKQNQQIHPFTIRKSNKRSQSKDRSITASPLAHRFKFHFQ